MDLIDKSAVVAEIERRMEELYELLPDASKVENGAITISESCNTGKYTTLESFSKFLDTLEVKEVDLDKLLIDFMSRYAYQNNGEYPSAIDIAKHFFELGFKVNNDVVIEKACDWLKTNVTYTHPRTGKTKCVINLNAFRNAMKGE